MASDYAGVVWAEALAAYEEGGDPVAVVRAELETVMRADHAVEVARWQPIDTAPRDGTAVLVMGDDCPGLESGRAVRCDGTNTYVAAWWVNEGDGGRWICYMDMVQDPECPIEPTHWMPLPMPPIMIGGT